MNIEQIPYAAVPDETAPAVGPIRTVPYGPDGFLWISSEEVLMMAEPQVVLLAALARSPLTQALAATAC